MSMMRRSFFAGVLAALAVPTVARAMMAAGGKDPNLSVGWWGDIGYAEMRTFADRAELQLVENDFFFPKPLGKGESRPREWDEIMAENRASAHMTFPF